MSEAFFAQAGSVCWMTSPEVVDVAREAHGGTIDLDPCAPVDTRYNHATLNWRLAEGVDCLQRRFWGPRKAAPTKTLVNPPFGSSYIKGADTWHEPTPGVCVSAKQMSDMKKAVAAGQLEAAALVGWRHQTTLDFAKKVVTERDAERADTVWISKAAMETEAIQLLLRRADAYCMPDYRIAYVDPETGKTMPGPTFPSVLFYLGKQPDSFLAAADKLGFCARLGGRLAA